MTNPWDQHPRPIPQASVQLRQAAGISHYWQITAADSNCPPLAAKPHGSNGDEDRFDASRIGNFHKGLPHDRYGEVNHQAYQSLLEAIGTPAPAAGAFSQIRLGLGRPLVNPQAGLATDLQGPDPKTLSIRAAPSLDSAEAAAEAVELYWMALLRDIPFTRFDGDSRVEEAAEELSRLEDFTGPRRKGSVTPEVIFRGCSPGNLVGPYLSQFLLKDIPYGSLTINQRQKTVVGARNYLTDYHEWLAVQDGTTHLPPDLFDPTPRYLRNMRDLGQYVHVDALYEAYLNACLILLGLGAPVDRGNPYDGPAYYANPLNNFRTGEAATQAGFGTFGGPHILSLVCEVATRALKAVWFQKWFVHRRLRPEAYGGLIHLNLHGLDGQKRDYPLHEQVLCSQAVEQAQRAQGSYLLPMAFPEGSPTHPAYGAGHATVAGACVTLLKAWFDENWVVPQPVVPTDDGTRLVPYTGADADCLTVGGELNKVAANIAIGRNMAGVHWRTDYTDSIRLGEQVALYVLCRQRCDYHEEDWHLDLTTFDGHPVRISRDGVRKQGADGATGEDYLMC